MGMKPRRAYFKTFPGVLACAGMLVDNPKIHFNVYAMLTRRDNGYILYWYEKC